MPPKKEQRTRAVIAIAAIEGYEYDTERELLGRGGEYRFALQAMVDVAEVYGFGVVEQLLRHGHEITLTKHYGLERREK